MGKNIFGLESYNRPLGNRFLHASIVPVDGEYLTTITVEDESSVVYAHEQRWATTDDATIDLHTTLAKLKKQEAEEDGEFDTHEPKSIGDVNPKLHYLSESLITYFIKRAGSTENFLQNIGAQPDVIQFVVSQPEDVAKRLVNEVRKNNQITVDQLAQLTQNLSKKQKYEPTRMELAMANHYEHISGMAQWLLLVLKKHRGKRTEMPPVANFPPYEFLYTFPELGETQPGMLNGVDWLIRELNQIADWVRNTQAQIASFDLAGAKAASDQWHEEQAAQGAGQGYEEKNVVFTLSNGWTIQQVRTANDLQVEGNLMGHCVGSYCKYVERGSSHIYSLRDPKNQPHVTIEVEGAGSDASPAEKDDDPLEVTKRHRGKISIVQIQGKENKEPIPEYKAMIKEWFAALGPDNIQMESGNSGLIERMLQKYSFRNHEYFPRLMDPIAIALADLAWNNDMREVQTDPKNWGIIFAGGKYTPDEAIEMFTKARSAMSGIHRMMDKHQEEFDKYDHDYGLNMDDFEDEEKFFEAEQELRDENYRSWLSGGFDMTINERWRELAAANGGKYPWDVLKELLTSKVQNESAEIERGKSRSRLNAA